MNPKRSISVVLPTRGESPWFGAALGSIFAQNLRPHEVLVVHTGAGPEPTIPAEHGVRLLTARGANLAAALNLGLLHARCPLVARMDDDDESLPERFERQLIAFESDPGLVALGTGFDRIDRDGTLIERCTVPTDPRDVRWRLLLGNCVTHGSVMMRREAVLAAGGYDESCERAQDFELWLRLTRERACIANLAAVLYRYRCDRADRVEGGWRVSPAQASVAARALTQAWARLPSITPDHALDCARGLVAGGAGSAPIEAMLTEHGPTIERLRALEWARGVSPSHDSPDMTADRLARLRNVMARVRASGSSRLWLWGAGRHTRWLISHWRELGVELAGVVDDHRAGERVEGTLIASPQSLGPGDHVLLSSDAHEEALWRSSSAARARGVTVWRLYGGAGGPATTGAAA